MGQQTPRNLDNVSVFEGSKPDFLIPTRTITSAVGTLPTETKGRMQNLTLRDLYHILGFRVGSSPGKLSPAVLKLQTQDIHLLGKIFAQHTGMAYPDMVNSCCCCT
jgi:hypothetical protein